ncbi:GNAT family N-acetyltransferase [Rhodococcus sp. HNM0569]|uniref:GNAT family N-acetyltransferase n=1 Tax=Rhodococcus sp. HNM0569 TaxID=2716340 RepID=UPI00146D75AC|nr:GNAT family N-acetyltransferase [Rhodococcus sp. HNM0569]NLU82241.1 GNAT family N-acetyltransferase [Rhodococcus sp. HNM0569]
MTAPDSTAQDRIQDRRELTAALVRALERRHEVLDAIVDSADRSAALASVAELLDTTQDNAAAVLGLTFERLTKAERRRTQAELDNLDASLSWTSRERPASTGRHFRLRPFADSSDDAALFARRCGEQHAEWDADAVDRERRGGLERIDDESAAWFVAEDTEAGTTVGMVFGELEGREVDVAIWIEPSSRKKGYGTAAVKHSRRELAPEFPGTVLVVRSPA